MATASASSSKGTTATTGPKISSRNDRARRVRRGDDRAREPEARARSGASPPVGDVDPVDVAGHLVAVRGGDQRAHRGAVGQRVADRDAAPPRRRAARRSGRTPSARRARGCGRSSPARSCRTPRTGAAAAAASRSASAKTMLALLPPSSSVTRFTWSAQPAMIRLPTAVDPVKPILRTSGCSTSRHPASAPVPTTTFEHALGQPGLEGQLGQAQRGERRQLGGLEHHRVARRPAPARASSRRSAAGSSTA